MVVVVDDGHRSRRLSPRWELARPPLSRWQWWHARDEDYEPFWLQPDGQPPTQLAIALLADALDDDQAVRWYVPLVSALVSELGPRLATEWEITEEWIRAPFAPRPDVCTWCFPTVGLAGDAASYVAALTAADAAAARAYRTGRFDPARDAGWLGVRRAPGPLSLSMRLIYTPAGIEAHSLSTREHQRVIAALDQLRPDSSRGSPKTG